MQIDKMREIIVEKLSEYSWETNVEIETSPANYGLESISITVEKKDIWVEVQPRTFKFSGELSFYAQLVSSGHSGYNENFSETISGTGEFSFSKNSTDFEVHNVELNDEIELYKGNSER